MVETEVKGEMLEVRSQRSWGKNIIGWVSVLLMIVLIGFVIWDYVFTKLENHEQRIDELENTARPLVIVDRFSHVYLNGEEVSKNEE